ncbi:MAG: hypothetical protein HQL45_17420 [Alphaproteobacteria bacterium]|nr:hypothetical protein [Alphaproteobacteria bacterium]
MSKAPSRLCTLDVEGIFNDPFHPALALMSGEKDHPSTREFACIDMLHRFCNGGHPAINPSSKEILFVFTGNAQGHGGGTTWLRLHDLRWRQEPGNPEFVSDFSLFIQSRFRLERKMAWQYSWAIVRAALLKDWNNLDALLSRASEAQQARMNATTKEARSQSDTANLLLRKSLEMAISDLRDGVVR